MNPSCNHQDTFKDNEKPEAKYVRLHGKKGCGRFIFSCIVANFVQVMQKQNTLELQFFMPLDRLTIRIKDRDGALVYQEIVDADKTLHLFVNLQHWNTGQYNLSLRDNTGICIDGEFIHPLKVL